MAIKVQQSKHADYAWEVYASKKHFGKLIKKGFKTKREAERFKNELAAKERIQTIPIDPKVALMVARYQEDLTLEEMEEALMEKRAALGKFNTSFGDVCAQHLLELQRMEKRGACTADHVRDYRLRMPNIDDWLGNPMVNDINKAMLEEFVDEQLLELPGHNGTKSPRTIKNYMDQISAVFNWAIREGLAHKNPTLEIKLGHYKPEVHICKPAELEKLLKHADWAMRAWIMFGAFGGCRSSEIRLLRWEDIRLEEGSNGQFYVPGKKNVCAERWVNLTPPLRDYCEQMLVAPKNAPADWERTGLVMRGMHMSSIIRRRETLFEKAGVRIKRNALRHTFGSAHLVKYGNPMVTAVEMGHYTPQTTFAYYRKAVRASEADRHWGFVRRAV